MYLHKMLARWFSHFTKYMSLFFVVAVNSPVFYFEYMVIKDRRTAYVQIKGKFYLAYLRFMILMTFLHDLDLIIDVNFMLTLKAKVNDLETDEKLRKDLHRLY